MNLRDLLRIAEIQLSEGPHPDRARLDAEALLRHLFKRNRAWLLTRLDQEAPSPLQARFESLVSRRLSGEPLQYIVGETEFFGLPFTVTTDVLIPRPETEHLVEAVIQFASSWQAQTIRIADIGTGSGIIAIALAKSLPDASIVAIDLSPQALADAQINALRNQVESKIRFLEGDLLAPLRQATLEDKPCHPEHSEGSASQAISDQRFHIIASNPPYVPSTDLQSLSIEVRDHEPHTALFAGEDGLAIYRRLIPEARHHLVHDGWLVLEIGYRQQPAIEALLKANGYREIHFIPDYQGIPRVAAARISA